MDKTQNNLEEILEAIRNEVALENGYSLTMPTYWGFAMLLTRRTKKQLWLYEQVMWKLIQKYYTPNSQIKQSNKSYANKILDEILALPEMQEDTMWAAHRSGSDAGAGHTIGQNSLRRELKEIFEQYKSKEREE